MITNDFSKLFDCNLHLYKFVSISSKQNKLSQFVTLQCQGFVKLEKEQ
jgi:hypothetical protein